MKSRPLSSTVPRRRCSHSPAPGLALVLFLLVSAAAAAPVQAQGYFDGTKGARASGRAGAFTARADDLSALQVNPAGLRHVQGTLIQVGDRFSHNAYGYTRDATRDVSQTQNGVAPLVAFDEVDNGHPWQLLDPILGVASNLGLQQWRFALAAYAPAGIGREAYPRDGGQRYMMVSRDSQMLDYVAAAAFTPTDTFAVGASLQWIVVPKLQYQLVFDGTTLPREAHPVASGLDMLATVDSTDPFTLNAIVGAQFKPAPSWELGVAGQVIPTSIEAHGTLAVEPLSSKLTDEVILRRGVDRANDVRLRLPLPITARAGIRYIQHDGKRELFDIELDGGYEAWSVVRQFTLDTNGIEAEFLGQRLPIDKVNIEKHWRDIWSARLGGDYAVIANLLTARGGVFYQSAAAPAAYANVDFAAASQLGGALGLSLLLQHLEIALAYELHHALEVHASEADARVYQQVPGSQCTAPYTDTDLCNEAYLGQPSPVVNAGRYRATSHVVAMDVLYRF